MLQQEKITAPELARRFEVSRRTISRDIDTLCQAGIPLITSQGHDGGISLAEGYKLDKALLTAEELQTIITGLQGLDSVSARSYSQQFLEKLAALGSDAMTCDETIVIDLASHYQDSLTPKIQLLKEAIAQQLLVTFRYYAINGDHIRTVEPYRLVFKWSAWYVFGYCQKRADFRLFKLNRLWELALTAESYCPRSIPTQQLHFDDYFSGEKIHLMASFAASARYRLIEEYGPHCYTQQIDGRLLLERDFISYDNMQEWILSFGDQVLVLEPQSFRTAIVTQAQNIIDQYQAT